MRRKFILRFSAAALGLFLFAAPIICHNVQASADTCDSVETCYILGDVRVSS